MIPITALGTQCILSPRIFVRTTSTELGNKRSLDWIEDDYAVHMRWEEILRREQLNPNRQTRGRVQNDGCSVTTCLPGTRARRTAMQRSEEWM